MTEQENKKQTVSNPHDTLFKKIWSNREAARDLLANFLPGPVLELIDLESLAMCKDSFVDDRLKEFFSDLVYEISIGNRPACVYVLFDHKSKPERTTVMQLHTYVDRIWRLRHEQKGLPLPVVVPVVLYHGERRWNFGTDLLPLLEDPDPRLHPYIPNFEFILIDLSRHTDDQIKGEVLCRVGLLLLKHVFSPGYEDKLPEILSLMRELLEKETGMQYIEAVLRYVFSTAENIDVDDLKRIVKDKLSERQEEAIMTLAEKLRQEGRKEGVKEGRKEGVKASILSLVRNAKRQGLSEETIAGILGLDTAAVKEILTREDFEVPLHLLQSDENP